MRSHQSLELLAHGFCDVWILCNRIALDDAVKQLRLNVFTQSTFVLLVALLRELVKHVFESGSSICLRLGEDSKVAKTIIIQKLHVALLLRLMLEE